MQSYLSLKNQNNSLNFFAKLKITRKAK